MVPALQLLVGVCRSGCFVLALLERAHDQKAVGIDIDVTVFPKLHVC